MVKGTLSHEENFGIRRWFDKKNTYSLLTYRLDMVKGTLPHEENFGIRGWFDKKKKKLILY